MKKFILLLSTLLIVACTEGRPPPVPCPCARNLVYCVESYPQHRDSFTPQQWDTLCQNDLHVCECNF